jgi:hypothetical protein
LLGREIDHSHYLLAKQRFPRVEVRNFRLAHRFCHRALQMNLSRFMAKQRRNSRPPYRNADQQGFGFWILDFGFWISPSDPSYNDSLNPSYEDLTITPSHHLVSDL